MMWSPRSRLIVVYCYLNWLYFFNTCLFFQIVNSDELWRRDLTKDMTIGTSTSGYENVQLRCNANSMQVDITLDDQISDDFQGVIYTRGSFHRKQPPCYIDSDDPTVKIKNGRSYRLKFPLNKCQTLNNGDIYSNVIVIQHDRDLIMPGDAAFTVECDFSKTREITVGADLNGNKKATASRIILTDADPAAHHAGSRHKRSMAESQSDFVQFTPKHVNRNKQNLSTSRLSKFQRS